jgi:inosine-uridine nucleoside N-ribohydrolase
MERDLVVDTDPGLDDALALTYLWEHHEITLITTVAGNSYLDEVTNNAAHLKDVTDAKTPIRAGASQPLDAPQVTTPFHGDHGLGAIDTDETTVNDFHTEQLPDNPVILAIGPLTNIAEMTSALPEQTLCFILGGTLADGNIHGEEFNFYADPHAANQVLHSHLDITLLPIDVASDHGIPINKADTYQSNKPVTQRIWDELRRASEDVQASTVTPYDLLLAYLLFHDHSYKTKSYDASVRTDQQRRGHLELHEGNAIDIITDIDNGVMENAVKQTLK